MTNIKKISLCLLQFFTITAFASEYTANAIHTITLTKDFTHCISVYISTKVGYLNNGTCQYEKETDRTKNEILFCSEMSLPLNGKTLKELVGPGYQCAATRISDLYAEPYSKTYALDEFQLISDNAGNYVGSKPSTGKAIIRK